MLPTFETANVFYPGRSQYGEKRFFADGLFEERLDYLHLVGRCSWPSVNSP